MPFCLDMCFPFLLEHRDQIASQRAEQAKAILAEKYTAIRLSNTVDTSGSTPGRYDSLRRHKQQALAGGAAPEGNGTFNLLSPSSFLLTSYLRSR
jgi:hypothetical protein